MFKPKAPVIICKIRLPTGDYEEKECDGKNFKHDGITYDAPREDRGEILAITKKLRVAVYEKGVKTPQKFKADASQEGGNNDDDKHLLLEVVRTALISVGNLESKATTSMVICFATFGLLLALAWHLW